MAPNDLLREGLAIERQLVQLPDEETLLSVSVHLSDKQQQFGILWRVVLRSGGETGLPGRAAPMARPCPPPGAAIVASHTDLRSSRRRRRRLGRLVATGAGNGSFLVVRSKAGTCTALRVLESCRGLEWRPVRPPRQPVRRSSRNGNDWA